MTPETVRFSGDSRVFALSLTMCSNLECGCGEFSFHLGEVPGASAPEGPLKFDVRVKAETWTEVAPPERPAAVKAMVAELLQEYPEAQRVKLQAKIAKRKTAARRLETYRIAEEDIATSRLVYFGEIVSELGGMPADDFSFAWRFQWQGIEFYAVDGYCPVPECQCEDVHLHFFELSPPASDGEPPTAEERCKVTLGFNGKMTIDDRHGCSEGAARAIFDAWRQQCGDVLTDLRWRYDKVKEIARRTPRRVCIPAEPWSLPIEPFRASPDKAGRNDPCPCGSGVKYKKCCGR